MTELVTYTKQEDGTLVPVTAVYMTAEELSLWSSTKAQPTSADVASVDDNRYKKTKHVKRVVKKNKKPAISRERAADFARVYTNCDGDAELVADALGLTINTVRVYVSAARQHGLLVK